MQRIQHDLIQGSDEWHAFRLQHHGASEAAVMLGLSNKGKRSELLFAKHTGIAKVFSDWVQENVLDRGHEVEALTRPLVEQVIGQSLFPVTYSYGSLSASCDGLTADDTIGFECKQWNQTLPAAIRAKELPEEYWPQVQQCLYVTGAEKWIFAVSDGTPERFEWMEILPDPAYQERITRGWAQFEKDLADYTPPEVVPEVIAAPIKDLPAIVVTVDGALTIETNFAVWGRDLDAFIARIPKAITTDQELADGKAAVAALKKAEETLEAEEARVLGCVPSVDDMRRQKKLLQDTSRTARLALEKLVTASDANNKALIVQEGKDALRAHIVELNARLGGTYMALPTTVDFAAAIKNKRSYASMRESVGAMLAGAKIDATLTADRMAINLQAHAAIAPQHRGLFPDLAQIVGKANDDFAAVLASRIAQHEAREIQRIAAERARMESEAKAAAEREREKIAAEERAKIENEQRAADAQRLRAEELERHATATAEAARQVAAQNTPREQPASASANEEQGNSSARPAETLPEQKAPTRAGITGRGRLLDRLDDLAAQLTDVELSDLCIAAAHILANRARVAA